MSRLCIFAHYDKDHIIDDYVVKYIEGLKTVSDRIIFVSSCNISEQEKQKVRPYCSDVLVKANEGYDFGAWKFGLKHTGKFQGHYLRSYGGFGNGFFIVERYDEVILANDSCFGPIYPFKEMFDKMATKECDVWGLTLGKSYYNHLQSYFLVIKRNVFTSKAFAQFFDTVQNQKTKYDYIMKYEIGFSKMLDKNKFKYDYYCKIATDGKKYDLKWFAQKIVKNVKSIFKPSSLGRPNIINKLITMLKVIKNPELRNPELTNPSIFGAESLLKMRCPLIKKMFFDHKQLSDILGNDGLGFVVKNNLGVKKCLKDAGYNPNIIKKYIKRINLK